MDFLDCIFEILLFRCLFMMVGLLFMVMVGNLIMREVWVDADLFIIIFLFFRLLIMPISLRCGNLLHLGRLLLNLTRYYVLYWRGNRESRGKKAEV
jgi:hypothetical protein